MSHPFPFTFTDFLNYLWRHNSTALCCMLFITVAASSLEGVYIERFSTTDNGGIAFTGNTVGLAKSSKENNPGRNDSIGAFITTNPNLQVNNYPAGTTLSIAENSSAAVLDLPSGSDVLYAELIWSGSYGFPVGNLLPPPDNDCTITFTTPQQITHRIKADPATAQNDLTPGFSNSGNYVRTANVTSLVQLGGRGTYIVGQIPGTVDKMDEEHNAAGWTLAVVYRNSRMYTQMMALWVGCEQGKDSKAFHFIDDFCTPPYGLKGGRLFISAIEGDAVRKGDHVLFGSQEKLTFPADALYGTNNPVDNFFGCQINTLIEMSKDENGKLIPFGHAQIDKRGTFGLHNHDAQNHHNVEGARQGYDITSIDISNRIHHNQTTAFIQGQTMEGDEDYTIGALAFQIHVDAPILTATKLVNFENTLSTPLSGQTLTFTIKIENRGTADARKVLVKNLLQKGLSPIPGSFKVNGVTMPDRYFQLVPIGILYAEENVLIEYQATVESSFMEGKPKIKSSKIDYQTRLDAKNNPIIDLTASTNPILVNP